MTFENYSVQYNNFSNSALYSQISPRIVRENRNSIKKNDPNRNSNGQMVVSSLGKIVSLNQKFISLWNLPEHLIDERSEKQVMKFIAEQLSNPENFLVNLQNHQKYKVLEMKKIVQLKDGRILSHIMKPQWSNTMVVGRIYLSS